jgi:Holliday junction resolvase
MKESTLIPKILAALRARGCKCIKMHGSQYAVKGTPDILGCCPGGQMFALEVKKPGGEAPFYDHVETPKQHSELMAWKQAGARVGVVRSVEEAVRLV